MYGIPIISIKLKVPECFFLSLFRAKFSLIELYGTKYYRNSQIKNQRLSFEKLVKKKLKILLKVNGFSQKLNKNGP